jgi:predicted phage terminase large subunit-like protein
MPQPRTTTVLDLHRAQAAFCRSSALYRCLVGGIGSGKSWAGSYDLIRRSKPGRLYLVVAPTYGMLCDATLRSFLAMAERLGVVRAGDIKKSAPPAVRLLTGAEVLFRSADEPDRLRGPNLSGVWLDEASLMQEDTFTIAIGRLREDGEQGWLTATFTPKGRGHWTYDTFASGRPNTFCVRARTADNPFLPPAFTDTLRQHYTSTLAAQELDGEFCDPTGGLFRRAWFSVVEAAPNGLSLVRAWDLASTPTDEKGANDPDWTAGVLLGRARDGDIYLVDVRRLRGSPQTVQNLVRQTAELDGRRVPIYMEQEPGSAGVALIDHYSRLLAGWNFRGERSTGSKADRAQPLAAQAEAGHVKLVRGTWTKDFLDEAEIFPLGSHDDQIDATTLGFGKITAPRSGWFWWV